MEFVVISSTSLELRKRHGCCLRYVCPEELTSLHEFMKMDRTVTVDQVHIQPILLFVGGRYRGSEVKGSIKLKLRAGSQSHGFNNFLF
jgi:hypothetical protein